MKICGKCKLNKPLSDYGNRRSSKDGLYTWCKSCCKDNSFKYRCDNDAKVKLDRNKWQKENPLKVRANRKNWLIKNVDFNKEIQSKYKKTEASKTTMKAYRKNNKHKRAALRAGYRARKLKATPLWLTPLHLLEINTVYEKAHTLTRSTGILHHVDHEVPLSSRDVCGLHVPWNLKVITAVENTTKGNRLRKEP